MTLGPVRCALLVSVAQLPPSPFSGSSEPESGCGPLRATVRSTAPRTVAAFPAGCPCVRWPLGLAASGGLGARAKADAQLQLREQYAASESAMVEEDATQRRQRQDKDIQHDVYTTLDTLKGNVRRRVDDVFDGVEDEPRANRTSDLIERADGLSTNANAFMHPSRQRRQRGPVPTEQEKQAARRNPRWIEDRQAKWCMLCKQVEFWWKGPASWTRHHCRSCGWVVCLECCPADQTMQLASWVSSTTGHPVKTGLPAKAKRVCNSCKMNVSEAV